jgi:hypothetical protein
VDNITGATVIYHCQSGQSVSDSEGLITFMCVTSGWPSPPTNHVGRSIGEVIGDDTQTLTEMELQPTSASLELTRRKVPTAADTSVKSLENEAVLQ